VLADEEVAVVEGGGGEFDDDFVGGRVFGGDLMVVLADVQALRWWMGMVPGSSRAGSIPGPACLPDLGLLLRWA